ncbi:tissue factor pathway inhibitor 2 isoform X1 [Ictalurus punctatus]|uniref:Tissue factor pathway inhibitor n=1 Tax=Ictalurus punctatus TaxID=7998 RepID=A0A2D0PXA1_ICTPU|nr:tissue factor pathway inhibitor 2 isoform X1 [Ictalurus punctatus]
MEGRFLGCFLLITLIQSAFAYILSPREVCLLQVDEGPCLDDVPRFYYNTLTQDCEEFSYGGCEGNFNNFKSYVECRKTCYSIPKIPRICRLPKEEGPCFAISKRYFFNMTSMRCEEFSYGGCYGNNNNFQNRNLCTEYCIPSNSVPVICLGGLDEGTGSASIPRYYYDSTQKECIQFKYTGSGGNNNNFVSMKNCMGVCAKKRKPRRPFGQSTRILRKRL